MELFHKFSFVKWTQMKSTYCGALNFRVDLIFATLAVNNLPRKLFPVKPKSRQKKIRHELYTWSRMDMKPC